MICQVVATKNVSRCFQMSPAEDQETPALNFSVVTPGQKQLSGVLFS